FSTSSSSSSSSTPSTTTTITTETDTLTITTTTTTTKREVGEEVDWKVPARPLKRLKLNKYDQVLSSSSSGVKEEKRKSDSDRLDDSGELQDGDLIDSDEMIGG